MSIIVFIFSNDIFAQQADSSPIIAEQIFLGSVSQADISLADNTDSGHIAGVIPQLLPQADAVLPTSEEVLSKEAEHNAKSLFEICVSNSGKEKIKLDNPIYYLCDSYIKNQIKRMKTTTDIQSYYLKIRLEQKDRSAEVKFIVFSMIFVALILATIQIGFGVFGTSKNGNLESEIEVSFNKLKLTSSISGFILLAISFLFFSLYISHVYTIQ
ncbi:hypothetical protein [Paraglaciecola sp. L3A3]|uniref:hypothetical protein n=1 Tax=Paraglaciecola sp. L3A3 TaxID=2686358 RepID=UPI00131E2F07|nr:hypothetical protein [Paraglaciecola sp. L3A3]